MWELSNRTRFVAERTFTRDRDGAEVLLVVVKATFTIGDDGEVTVAEHQVPVTMTPVHSGEPGSSSLLHDSDFALTRHLTDVLVVGHARSRDERGSIAVEAGIRIAGWQKRIWVVGDRRWEKGLTGWILSDPEPFVEMPLVYEKAFGGVDASEEEAVRFDDNPVGTGLALSEANLVGKAAPNLEDPDDLLETPLQRPRPMSFGPIAREWAPRRALAGTFDDRWKRERRPLVPLDFDDRFFQSAPPDQQVPLGGGEEVELVGMDPRGTLRFRLPKLELTFRSRIQRRIEEHGSTLHSVVFEPDLRRLVMVYGSALPCHQTIHTLTRTVVREAEHAA